jgi:hypothetical protein
MMEDFGHAELVFGWYEWVSSFSGLELSHNGDKLPAISGLAKKMGQRRPSARYLAGLWDDSLEMDLLWVRNSNHERPIPADWRAPSWSWAPINSEVHFPFKWGPTKNVELLEKYFNIHEAEAVPSTVDSTGQVESARLKMTCVLFPASFGLSAMDYRGEVDWILSVDGKPNRFKSRAGRFQYDLRPDNPSHVLDSYYEPGRLYFLQMARLRQSWDDTIGAPCVDEIDISLVVYRPDPSLAEYRRVGILKQLRHLQAVSRGGIEISTWAECPTGFETGGVEGTITIV